MAQRNTTTAITVTIVDFEGLKTLLEAHPIDKIEGRQWKGWLKQNPGMIKVETSGHPPASWAQQSAAIRAELIRRGLLVTQETKNIMGVKAAKEAEVKKKQAERKAHIEKAIKDAMAELPLNCPGVRARKMAAKAVLSETASPEFVVDQLEAAIESDLNLYRAEHALPMSVWKEKGYGKARAFVKEATGKAPQGWDAVEFQLRKLGLVEEEPVQPAVVVENNKGADGVKEDDVKEEEKVVPENGSKADLRMKAARRDYLNYVAGLQGDVERFARECPQEFKDLAGDNGCESHYQLLPLEYDNVNSAYVDGTEEELIEAIRVAEGWWKETIVWMKRKEEEKPREERLEAAMAAIEAKLAEVAPELDAEAEAEVDPAEELFFCQEGAKDELGQMAHDHGFSEAWFEKCCDGVDNCSDVDQIEKRMKVIRENVAAKVAKKEMEQMKSRQNNQANQADSKESDMNEQAPKTFEEFIAGMGGDKELERCFIAEMATAIKAKNRSAGADLHKVSKGKKTTPKGATLKAIRIHMDAAMMEGLLEAAKERRADELAQAKAEEAAAAANGTDEKKVDEKTSTNNETGDAGEEDDVKNDEEKTEAKAEGEKKANFLVRLWMATTAGFGRGLEKVGMSKNQREMRAFAKKVRKEAKKAIEGSAICRPDGDKDVQEVIEYVFGKINTRNGEYDTALASTRKGGGKMTCSRMTALQGRVKDLFVQEGEATAIAWAMEAIFVAGGEDGVKLMGNCKFKKNTQVANMHMSKQDYFLDMMEMVRKEAARAKEFYSNDAKKEMERHEKKCASTGILGRIKELAADSWFYARGFVYCAGTVVKWAVQNNPKAAIFGVAVGVAAAVVLGTGVLATAAITVAACFLPKLVSAGIGKVRGWFKARKKAKKVAKKEARYAEGSTSKLYTVETIHAAA